MISNCVVLPAGREQQRVVGQGIGGRLAPSPPRKRLVHTLVVEFRPEQLLQRVEPAKPLQQVENHLLPLHAWHDLGLRGLGRQRLEPDCITQIAYATSKRAGIGNLRRLQFIRMGRQQVVPSGGEEREEKGRVESIVPA